MKIFEKTLTLKKDYLDMIRKYLTEEPTCKEECLGEDETITENVKFDNGFEMDIKCCGVQYRENGESNTAWTEAVLFCGGAQVAFSDPCDEFEGDWELDDDYGNTYIVHIVCAE